MTGPSPARCQCHDSILSSTITITLSTFRACATHAPGRRVCHQACRHSEEVHATASQSESTQTLPSTPASLQGADGRRAASGRSRAELPEAKEGLSFHRPRCIDRFVPVTPSAVVRCGPPAGCARASTLVGGGDNTMARPKENTILATLACRPNARTLQSTRHSVSSGLSPS